MRRKTLQSHVSLERTPFSRSSSTNILGRSKEPSSSDPDSPPTKKKEPRPQKRIRARSKKTQVFYEEERIPFVIKFLEEHPICEVHWNDECQGASVDVHEVQLRSRGGNKVPKEGETGQFLAVCRICHHYVTINPKQATARGFIK